MNYRDPITVLRDELHRLLAHRDEIISQARDLDARSRELANDLRNVNAAIARHEILIAALDRTPTTTPTTDTPKRTTRTRTTK